MSRVSSADHDDAIDGVAVRDSDDFSSGSLDAEGPRGPAPDRGVSVAKIPAAVKPREPEAVGHALQTQAAKVWTRWGGSPLPSASSADQS